MSSTLAPARRITLSATSPDLAVVCLFSLFGLTLTVAILPYLSDETIHTIFSVFG